jgi:hypothetical protein
MTAKVNISELSRMYGKDRKTVHEMLKKQNISTERTTKGTMVQLADVISFWGEPKHSPTPRSQIGVVGNTQEPTPPPTLIFEEKISLLEQKLELLEQDREERRQREEELKQEKKRLLEMLEAEQEKTKTLMLTYQPQGQQQNKQGLWKRVFK